MSSDAPNEWEKLWKDYSASLEAWRRAFDGVLRANSEMQAAFTAVMKKASKESDMETMKRFGENWQKAMSDAGTRPMQEFYDYWQKAMGQSGNGLEQIAQSWQKSFFDGGVESMKAYGDTMKKFAETWNSMWPQK